MDRLAAIFERFSLRANVFNSGAWCQSSDYREEDGHGHIHVLKAGRLRVESPGREPQLIEAPALLYYMRPITHRLVPLNNEEVVTVCAEIDFGDGLENPISQIMPELLSVDLRQHNALCNIINLLFDEAFSDHCGRQAALNRFCEVLVINLLRLALNDDSTQVGLLAALADKRLAKALNGIHRAPATPWTLEQLAQEAGMSRASFAETFRRVMGMTAGDYLSHWRLGLAKSLLKRGRPITRVSDEVGYSSPAAFSRAFTARFSMSPSDWLKLEASPVQLVAD